MKILYARVSSEDQNLGRQLTEGYDKVYQEKISGKDAERPQLQEMLTFLRAGDEIEVHDISRLARSLSDLLTIVEMIVEKNASIRFKAENISFTPRSELDPYQRLTFQLLGSLAQFERTITRARQSEGIALAKAKGLYKGRKPKFTSEELADIRQRFIASDNRAELARDLGIDRANLYKLVKGGQD